MSAAIEFTKVIAYALNTIELRQQLSAHPLAKDYREPVALLTCSVCNSTFSGVSPEQDKTPTQSAAIFDALDSLRWHLITTHERFKSV